MSRRTETCVVWTCDDCNNVHVETVLITSAAAPTGWKVIDGKDVCNECFRRRECEPVEATIYDTSFVRRCATDECYNGELLSVGDFDRWLAQVKAEALRTSPLEPGRVAMQWRMHEVFKDGRERQYEDENTGVTMIFAADEVREWPEHIEITVTKMRN